MCASAALSATPWNVDGPPELLAFRRVVGGHPTRLRHADLRRAQPDERAIQHPRRGATPVTAFRRRALCERPGEGQVRDLRPVGRGGDGALHAGSGGIDEEHGDLAVAGRRGHGCAVGDVGGRTLGFSPSSRQVPPSAVAVWGQRVVGAGLGEGGGQHDLTACDPRQPCPLLLGRTELGDGERRQDERRPQRHRRRAVLLLEEQAELGEAEAAAAVLLGDGDGEQPGVGEGAPQLTVDTLLAALDLLHTLGSRVALEDLRRQCGRRPAPRRT